MFFTKKDKPVPEPERVIEEEPVCSKAKEISEQYKQMERCCSVLSSVGIKKDYMFSMHSGGWRVTEYEITGAGIDIEDVYEYIRSLASKRKEELEEILDSI